MSTPLTPHRIDSKLTGSLVPHLSDTDLYDIGLRPFPTED